MLAGAALPKIPVDEGYKEDNKNDNNKINFEITPDGEEYDLTQGREEYDFYFQCNHCGVAYPRSYESFYCTCCDFHIYIKCYKNYFFFIGRDEPNKINVNQGNSYTCPSLCRFSYKERPSQKCKRCGIILVNIMNYYYYYYYCSNCNSNFCVNCYIFHKVIFDNSILIFDGNFNNENIKIGGGITFKRNNELNYKGYWINGYFNLIRNILHEHGLQRKILSDLQCKVCKKISNS